MNKNRKWKSNYNTFFLEIQVLFLKTHNKSTGKKKELQQLQRVCGQTSYSGVRRPLVFFSTSFLAIMI